MSPHIDTESLEALARGEPVANGALVTAHLAGCDACHDELAWLRKEAALFARRADACGPAEHLWDGIADTLARPASRGESPFRVNALPLPAPPKTRPARPWVLVAAALALASVGALGVVQARRAVVARSGVSAQVFVGGPVSVVVRTSSCDVRAEPGARDRLRVVTSNGDASPQLVALDARTYEVRFARGAAPRGLVRVEVPAGSGVDVTTSSGDVSFGPIDGPAKVLTSSGDIDADAVSDLDVTTTSGDVRARSVSGRAAVRTSSGEISVRQRGAASNVLLTSTSGSISWAGLCGAPCGLVARSNSGDVRLELAPESAAWVGFESSSGDLRDGVRTALVTHGSALVRRVGAGGGSISVFTTSGDLVLAPAN